MTESPLAVLTGEKDSGLSDRTGVVATGAIAAGVALERDAEAATLECAVSSSARSLTRGSDLFASGDACGLMRCKGALLFVVILFILNFSVMRKATET